jgi:hypothetical protein
VNKPTRNDSAKRAANAPTVSAWILRTLGAVPGLTVKPDRRRRRITVRAGQGPKASFDVHEERTITEERARTLSIRGKGRDGSRTLLATTHLTPRARTILRNADVSWIERETGRCRLSAPGMLVEVDVGPLAESETHTPRNSGSRKLPPALLRDKSGLVAETLLLRPHRGPIVLTELATAAGLSRGLVSRLLARLTSLGVLIAHGSAPRKHWTLGDPGALLDLWADEERVEPEEVTAINVWSRTPADLLDRAAQFGNTKLRYAVAGIAAANLHAPTLSVDPTPDVWIPADVVPTQAARIVGGEVVESGANMRLLQKSGDAALRNAGQLPERKRTAAGIWVISPYRAYVEARRTAGRGSDVAAALRDALALAPTRTRANADA